jgi:hypothetical protein
MVDPRSEIQAPGGFPENPAFRFRIETHLVSEHAQVLAIRCLGTPEFARDAAPPNQRSGRFGLVVNAITTAPGLIDRGLGRKGGGQARDRQRNDVRHARTPLVWLEQRRGSCLPRAARNRSARFDAPYQAALQSGAMSDSTLLTLYDEVRGKTLELLAGVGERESLRSPPRLHNSIRWHAGQGRIPEYVGFLTTLLARF